MKEDALMYVGQKAFIEKDGEVLVCKLPEGIDFPGGKIQENETDIIESLKREVKEEVGIEIETGTPFTVWTNIFPPRHRLAGKRVYLIGFKCKYISGKVTLSNEHESFVWVNKSNYKNLDNGGKYFAALHAYFQN